MITPFFVLLKCVIFRRFSDSTVLYSNEQKLDVMNWFPEIKKKDKVNIFFYSSEKFAIVSG